MKTRSRPSLVRLSAQLITLAMGCDQTPAAPSPPSVAEGLCQFPIAKIDCVHVASGRGGPRTTTIDFTTTDNEYLCAELRQTDDKPDRITAATLILDDTWELMGPSALNQNTDRVSVAFESSPGMHTLALERRGTKKGEAELCLHRVAAAEDVQEQAILPDSAGSFTEPTTGFNLAWSEGAVDSETQIWCAPTGPASVTCQPHGTTFDQPLIVSFPYDRELAANGNAPTIVRDGETLLTMRSLEPPVVRTETTHFSSFELVYDRDVSLTDGFSYLGGVDGLADGQVGVVSFNKRAGHRYTVTISSPPIDGAPASGNVDLFGHWQRPEDLGISFQAEATSNGWASINVPASELIEYADPDDNQFHVRGTEDSFSFEAEYDGEFNVMLAGAAPTEGYAALRVVESPIESVPQGFEGLLHWPFLNGVNCDVPTTHGAFNSPWGNGTYAPYYVEAGWEPGADGKGPYYTHNGVDIACPAGTVVWAVCNGPFQVVKNPSMFNPSPLGNDLGHLWGGYVLQECTGTTGETLTVGYLHLDGILVDEGEIGDPSTPLGTTYGFTLPGEPQHLHLGICQGTVADGCKPQSGATKDKFFPHQNSGKYKEGQLTSEVFINPDICTNPGLWHPSDVEWAVACD